MGDAQSRARPRRQAHGVVSSLLVVAVDAGTGPAPNLAWDVTTRAEPRLRHLVHLTDPAIPMPRLHRTLPDNSAANSVTRGRGLAGAIAEAERIAFLAPLHSGDGVGAVLNWHHQIDRSAVANGGFAGRPRLSKLSFPSSARHLGLYHLPLWLEDEMPAGGIDFIGISVPATETLELHTALDRQLPLIVAAVTGLLWRIMREVSQAPESFAQAA